ncbi:MAG: response regulator [Cyclobacteriaceae bacterium]|nr:response regulator [Cyclobacteriaceae bacterium]
MKTLIIDDDEIVIFIHKTLVEQSGLDNEPVVCLNGREAHDYLMTANPENKYLLLLDINMPVMDGWELMQTLQNHSIYDRIYTVMVTSSIDQIDRVKSREFVKIIKYLEKPLTLEDVMGIKKGIEN